MLAWSCCSKNIRCSLGKWDDMYHHVSILSLFLSLHKTFCYLLFCFILLLLLFQLEFKGSKHADWLYVMRFTCSLFSVIVNFGSDLTRTCRTNFMEVCKTSIKEGNFKMWNLTIPKNKSSWNRPEISRQWSVTKLLSPNNGASFEFAIGFMQHAAVQFNFPNIWNWKSWVLELQLELGWRFLSHSYELLHNRFFRPFSLCPIHERFNVLD